MRAARETGSTSSTRSSAPRSSDDGAVERARDPRLDAADDARAAAVGDHGDVRVRRPFEHGLHLGLVARAHDDVDDVLVAPAEAADRVDVGLAEAVAGAVAVLDRADRRQHVRDGDPRRGQRGVGSGSSTSVEPKPSSSTTPGAAACASPAPMTAS